MKKFTIYCCCPRRCARRRLFERDVRPNLSMAFNVFGLIFGTPTRTRLSLLMTATILSSAAVTCSGASAGAAGTTGPAAGTAVCGKSSSKAETACCEAAGSPKSKTILFFASKAQRHENGEEKLSIFASKQNQKKKEDKNNSRNFSKQKQVERTVISRQAGFEAKRDRKGQKQN